MCRHLLLVVISRYTKREVRDIERLMTDPKGNSECCFPETLNEYQLKVEGKKTHCFPYG